MTDGTKLILYMLAMVICAAIFSGTPGFTFIHAIIIIAQTFLTNKFCTLAWALSKNEKENNNDEDE